MSKGRDRMVYRNEDGDWVNKRNHAKRASIGHLGVARTGRCHRARRMRQFPRNNVHLSPRPPAMHRTSTEH